ncbi:hypothetical protein [Sphingobium sp. Ant17]|uniref:hypothetical protein n=1 Tax=Sphingobium sp. Ant17 TaxID=1461752 RepID=UPI0004484429|nr:hypothetical protein [Sphingobium sp. Ant17]EXS69257.1 hypothetical protein BF95_11270 [Sphingobium sp. Ant17]
MPVTRDHDSVADLRFRALSRWDNEGGAIATTPQVDVPLLTPAELVQMRIRVIAVENVLIAVLAEGSDRQRQVARDMATYIAPRPGASHHSLTIEAGKHITALVDRAVHFQSIDA